VGREIENAREDISRLALIKAGLIPLGRRKITKEGAKYKIYLPKRMNSLWAELSEKGLEVEIFLAITGPLERETEVHDKASR